MEQRVAEHLALYDPEVELRNHPARRHLSPEDWAFVMGVKKQEIRSELLACVLLKGLLDSAEALGFERHRLEPLNTDIFDAAISSGWREDDMRRYFNILDEADKKTGHAHLGNALSDLSSEAVDAFERAAGVSV